MVLGWCCLAFLRERLNREKRFSALIYGGVRVMAHEMDSQVCGFPVFVASLFGIVVATTLPFSWTSSSSFPKTRTIDFKSFPDLGQFDITPAATDLDSSR